jgi:hypothetical protein
MSISFDDLQALKTSLVAFLFSIVFAIVLLSYIEDPQIQAVKDRQIARQSLVDARAQLTAAQNDLQNMAIYQQEYQALEAQKIIGNEQRLDWIEGLEKLRKQGVVQDFQYAIAPQQGYSPNPPLELGSFTLNLSPMTLQVDLLHEEQLLHLFTALHNQTQGWFILDRCSLSKSVELNGSTTSLRANCAGGWLTMKNRNQP